ncbi:RHS repeat-associated core domain-containing protein, partial [Soonwooa purpurea]
NLPVFDPLSIPYNYKYNGMELQESGMYDYGARFYMPDIGRWGQHDPLSEITHDPFGYVYNNPIRYNDPTGMEGEETSSSSGGETNANGGCCPDGDKREGASFDGKPYDGGIKSYTINADKTTSTEIDEVNIKNNNQKSSSPVRDFVFGGGGKFNSTISSTLSSIWNSSLSRAIIPDRMGLTMNATGEAVFSTGIQGGIELILRGRDAGIYIDPGNTMSGGITAGLGGSGGISLFASRFSGKVEDITLSSVVGMEAYGSGTLALGGGVTGSYSVSFDPNPNNGPVLGRWHTTSGGIVAGARGSLGVGVSISNTRIGIGFDGKSRIADYSGLITGKGSY